MALRRACRWLEGFLWAVGFLALAWCTVNFLMARLYQDEQTRALGRLLGAENRGRVASEPVKPRQSAPAPAAGELDPAFVARLEIPRLHLSAIVREGDGSRTLKVAVGHLPGTALPGEAGNVCLAAHRDGFFRGLGNLQPGDAVTLTTQTGRYAYRVDAARVVAPDDVAALEPTGRPTLTLVTCYPFAWIGPAPRRYVVTAHPVDRAGSA